MRGEAGDERQRPSPTPHSESEDDDSDGSTQSIASDQATGTDAEEAGELEAAYPPSEGYPEEVDEEEDALEVVVETLVGETFRVRVSQWDTPAGLKDLLYQTQGIPPNQQHLVLGEKELVEEMCLMEQGVVNGSRLRLVVAMRGGPITARRHPSHDDMLWSEFSDYLDVNRDDLWDGVGGRTVTLLVLREGENVNVYRVVENQDGSYSPLNESWGSLGSDRIDDGGGAGVSEEEARTRQRMAEIQARMADLKLKNKNKKEKQIQPVSTHQSLNNSIKTISDMADELPSPRVDLSEGMRRPIPTPLTTPLATPRERSGTRRLSNASLGNVSRRGGRGSRPSTQERLEFNRTNLPRTTLKEIPMANPPIPVDFTRRKPLEGIRPIRLSAVDEDRGRGDSPPQHPDSPSSEILGKNYDSYRKSIVKHGISSEYESNPLFSESMKSNHEAWPRRDAPMPLYMLPETQSDRYDRDRLNHSHNQTLLRSVQHTAVRRPKTSPEVLERRPGTTGNQSTISERIQLRAADDRLLKMCSILGSPPGHSQESQRLTDSPSDSIPLPPSLSTSLSGSNSLVRRHRTNSVSVSLASLRSRGGTPPSPGRGALVTSGSRESRDALRGLMRSQGGISRRTTPDHGPLPLRRPLSGKGQGSTTHLPPVTPQRRRTRRRPKCEQCSRRLSVATTYECRCGGIFCAQHRYAETHTCSFDYRTAGRTLLTLSNPYVAPSKLPKI